MINWLWGWLTLRPHFSLPGYLRRWHLTPKNPWFKVYLHHFTGSDDDRALHDHPWASVSLLIWGTYIEHRPGGRKKVFKAFSVIRRSAEYTHRIELVSKTCWTIFIMGPKKREWGFYCPKGWTPNQEFEEKGCD